jgi:adenylate cyclase
MLKNNFRIYLILFSIIYWILVAFYYATIRYAGTGPAVYPAPDYTEVAAYSAVVGFSIGLLFGLFPLQQLLQFKKRRSFLRVVLFGTGCYVLFFMSVVFLSSWYGNPISFAIDYLFSPGGLTVLFHLSVSSLLYQFILSINRKFGPGILVEYTVGRYFKPKEEERAFIFLDLKSSTHIAEKLEHVTYSRLVQDCYAELTMPLIRYKAQIYQYVGDEVVVSWKMSRFFSAAACYDFFYAFRERMEAKREYFLQQYGLFPQFKAGIHCGVVTVAEVGEIKTEIAYHGDVLNTAARIQKLCNRFQEELLISESMLLHVPRRDQDRVSFVVEAPLRGKQSNTKIFTIRHATRVANN